MTMQIRQAERKQAKLRVGVFGPSGAGKTYSSLLMAHGFTDDWKKICVIDTENGSGDLYSDLGPYNVLTLTAPFSPEKYIEAIGAAEKAGMEVIIVDSITHEWAGPGGILEIADQLGADAKSSFTVWKKLTPRHNAFINKLLFANAHVIACGRSKQDYAINQTEKNGKIVNVPEKIGLKSITREGFDYEMTVSFDLGISHYAVSTKDRTGLFQDKPEHIITPETGKKLKAWSDSGKPDVENQKHQIMSQLKRLNFESRDRELIGKVILLNTKFELVEANYPAIIEELKKLDKLDLGTPPQTPPDQNNGPQGGDTPQTGTNATPPAETAPKEEPKAQEPPKPAEPLIPAQPASPEQVNLARTLYKQKMNEAATDEEIIEWLSFVHNIKVGKLEDLNKDQISIINKDLLKGKSNA